MTPARLRALPPVVAGVLLVLLVWSALVLRERLAAAEVVDALTEELENGEPPRDVLARALVLRQSGGETGEAASRRHDALIDRLVTRLLGQDVQIEVGDDGPSRPLSMQAAQPLPVGDATPRLLVQVSSDSPLQRALSRLAIGDHVITDLTAVVELELAFPEGRRELAVPVVAVTHTGTALGSEDAILHLVLDTTPPTLRFAVEDGTFEVGEDGRAIRRGVRPVRAIVEDDFARGTLRASFSGRPLTITPDGDRSASFVFGDGLLVANQGVLLIHGSDAAGNALERALTVVRRPKVAPKLEELTIAGRDAVGTSLTFAGEELEVHARIAGLDSLATVTMRLDADRVFPLVATEPGVYAGTLRFTADDQSLHATLLADNGETEAALADVPLLRDAEAPKAVLSRDGEDLLAQPIPVAAGDEIDLTILDASPLAGAPEIDLAGMTALGEGEQLAPGRWTRRFRIDDPTAARMVVTAADRFGQTARRRFDFAVADSSGATTADDGAGPVIRVELDGHALTGNRPNVLYGPTDDLVLIVDDPSGLAALEVEGADLSPEAHAEAVSGPTSFRAPLRGLEALSGLVVEATDRFGHVTRTDFSPVVVRDPPQLSGPAIREDGRVLDLSVLPARFSLAMAQVPPEGALRAVLRRQDEAGELTIPIRALNAEVASASGLTQGTWRLVVYLDAVDGPHEVATADVAVPAR